jgi:hypothetical protein
MSAMFGLHLPKSLLLKEAWPAAALLIWLPDVMS